MFTINYLNNKLLQTLSFVFNYVSVYRWSLRYHAVPSRAVQLAQSLAGCVLAKRAW